MRIGRFAAALAAIVAALSLALSSACAPGSVLSTTSSPAAWNTHGNPYDPTQTGWKITRDEALAFASTFLPASVVAAADIESGRGWARTGEPIWYVSFWDINIDKSAILYDESDIETHSFGPYTFVQVNIDASNGILYSIEAAKAFRGTRPPST